MGAVDRPIAVLFRLWQLFTESACGIASGPVPKRAVLSRRPTKQYLIQGEAFGVSSGVGRPQAQKRLGSDPA